MSDISTPVDGGDRRLGIIEVPFESAPRLPLATNPHFAFHFVFAESAPPRGSV